jgi:hypothetical protein
MKSLLLTSNTYSDSFQETFDEYVRRVTGRFGLNAVIYQQQVVNKIDYSELSDLDQQGFETWLYEAGDCDGPATGSTNQGWSTKGGGCDNRWARLHHTHRRLVVLTKGNRVTRQATPCEMQTFTWDRATCTE